MRASKCAGLPRIVSLAIAVSAEAQRASRNARTKPTQPSAAITLVPFMIARLSRAVSASGSRPTRASPSAAESSSPRKLTSRSPSSAAARYESGVRSPLAPTEPSSGIRGSRRRLRLSHSRSSTLARTPE